MNYVYIIAFAILFVSTVGKRIKRKPFSCELCMAFWLTLIYELVTGQQYGNAALVALATPILYNLYNKLIVLSLK